MKTVAKGFTLIELMIVVAIIAILAAMAIPRVQDYIARTQVTEAITLADGLKTPLVEQASQTGSCPANASVAVGSIAAKASITGKYVASVETAGNYPACTITATFSDTGVSAPLKGKSLLITGKLDNAAGDAGSSSWTCSSPDISQKYLPGTCTGI